MTARRAANVMPLFATDREIGVIVLGPKRAAEFVDLIPRLEKQPGFPRWNHLHGGRYVPAVLAWYDAQAGLTATPPAADGQEDWSAWRKKRTA